MTCLYYNLGPVFSDTRLRMVVRSKQLVNHELGALIYKRNSNLSHLVNFHF